MDQLAHRRASLPEQREVESLAAELAGLADQRLAGETAAGDIRREQDKFEADIAQVRHRMDRDRQRMDAGAVSSAKELESLQHEIDSLHRRQSELEDGELEVMQRLEDVERQLTELDHSSTRLSEAHADAVRRRDDALAEISADHESARTQRDALAPTVAADLLALYDRLRAQHDGVGAAALHQKRCEGCRLELNATDLGHVQSAPADEVLRCEECRRILVRTPESGL